MAKYLKGTVNYLTLEQANDYAFMGWIVSQQTDGTWSAVELVDAPVQPNQAPWKGRVE